MPANVNIHPYLAFVRDQIFLRFQARAYKRPEEKWEVGLAALKIIHVLLSDFTPAESDLDEKSGKRQPGSDHLRRSIVIVSTSLYFTATVYRPG